MLKRNTSVQGNHHSPVQGRRTCRTVCSRIRNPLSKIIREQLQVIQVAIRHFRSAIDEALAVCVKDPLWSANDLRVIAQHMTRLKETKPSLPLLVDRSEMDISVIKTAVPTREMADYIKILGGDL